MSLYLERDAMATLKRSSVFVLWMCNVGLALLLLVRGHLYESSADLDASRDGLSFYQASLSDGEWQWHSGATLLFASFVLFAGWILRSLAQRNSWLNAAALLWTTSALCLSALTYYPAERKDPIYQKGTRNFLEDGSRDPKDSLRYRSDQIHTYAAYFGLWAFYFGGACVLVFAWRSNHPGFRVIRIQGSLALILSFALMFTYVMIPSPVGGFIQRLGLALGLGHVIALLYNWMRLSLAPLNTKDGAYQSSERDGLSLQSGAILDGYQLIRTLGRGGFGEVWLCESTVMRDYAALKFISNHQGNKLEKEFEALRVYKRAVGHDHGAHLVPIHHVGKNAHGLYYIMPLADGYGHHDPCSESWQPYTLARLVEHQKTQPMWFKGEQVIHIMRQILEALASLERAGLMHRDVKPENIFFLKRKVCLADLSLLRDATTSQYTRVGTRDYVAPIWYKGHPDMYGASMTFYYLITGYAPETMGRERFKYPKTDPSTIEASEHELWNFFHNFIYQAISEDEDERFENFTAMAEALEEGGRLLDKERLLVQMG